MERRIEDRRYRLPGRMGRLYSGRQPVLLEHLVDRAERTRPLTSPGADGRRVRQERPAQPEEREQRLEE
jgi:hypothetical protein